MWQKAGLMGVLCAVLAACGPRVEGGTPAQAAAAQAALPRAALFSDAERKDPKLSPDGGWIGYLIKNGEGYDLVAASAADLADVRKLAAGVTSYEWAPGGTVAVYWAAGTVRAADVAATENPAVVEGAPDPAPASRLLVSQSGAKFLGANARRPGKVALQLGDDVFEIDARTGARTSLFQNRAHFAALTLDADNRVRLGLKRLANGDTEFWALDGKARPLMTLTRAATPYFTLRGFAPDGKSFFVLAPVGREKSALIRVDAATGVETVAAEDGKADIVDVWMDAKGEPLAYASEYLRREWVQMTDAAGVEIAFLKQKLQGDFTVVSRSGDDARWVIAEQAPTIAPRFWIYDRTAKTVERLFSERPALDNRSFAAATPVEIRARDGLILPGVLTAPARGEGPAPLIVLAADDPWTRNHLAFSPAHQLFADLGYAVLAINARGAAGFGVAYAKAGEGAFGTKMQSDLIDAAHWAVAQKFAAPGKIAIVGSGVGGYAAVAALAFTPQEFACAATIDAPLDLQSAPIEDIGLRIADPATAEGAAKLKALSPYFAADKIVKPLLLVHRDWRLKRAESDEMVAALAANKRPIAYAQFAAEGADFAGAPDRIAFYALASAFLAQCAGGRADPIGADFKNSSLQVLEGDKLIPSLATAMAPRDGDLGAPP